MVGVPDSKMIETRPVTGKLAVLRKPRRGRF
jgi:hypothetical protein